MIAAAHPWWPLLFHWPRFLDPLGWFWRSTAGYAFTSSGLQLTIPLGLLVYLRKHNCHVRRCPRLQWHPHPDHGHPVCRHHFPKESMPPAAPHDDAKDGP